MTGMTAMKDTAMAARTRTSRFRFALGGAAIVGMLGMGAVGLPGCEDHEIEPAESLERAGDQLERTGENVSDNLKEAGDEIEDAADDAVN